MLRAARRRHPTPAAREQKRLVVFSASGLAPVPIYAARTAANAMHSSTRAVDASRDGTGGRHGRGARAGRLWHVARGRRRRTADRGAASVLQSAPSSHCVHELPVARVGEPLPRQSVPLAAQTLRARDRSRPLRNTGASCALTER